MATPLDSERWARLATLLDTLLDAPPEDRAALVATLPERDRELREELRRLIDDLERSFALLDRPAAERFTALAEAPVARFPESLAGRYRLIREVGRGGMATVFLARDLAHARDVAIKVMRPEMTLGRERFHREIAICARLRHPHIVPLFDSGEADGALYYVMPYEEGESLRARLLRAGPLEVGDAVAVLRDILEALSHAHRHDIVHRDIKPDNVLLSDGHAMVTDFGVARAVSESAEGADPVTAGMALGTPAYMAPEQVTGDTHVDHRADIYAFGALAYEILCGRPPFVHESRHRVALAHLSETPRPLLERRPGLPPALSDLVMRCLRKAPAERWQRVTDLREALDVVEAPGTDVAPTGVRPAPRAAAPARADADVGHRAGAAGGLRLRRMRRVGGAILLLAAGSSGIVWWSRNGAERPPGDRDGLPPRRGTSRNIAAYELYLRGSDPSLLRSDSGARAGLEYFRQAVALDSSYAAAWSGLGRMYARLTSSLSIADGEHFYSLAEEASRKAVALDDSLAEAHATLGLLRMHFRDFRSAERHLKRALALDPSRARTHEWMVTLYLWKERPAEALEHARRALALDPLSPTAHAELAHALMGNDRCDEALAELERLADLQPPLLRRAAIAAPCYARKGMWQAAVAVLRAQADRGEPSTMAELGYVLARAGQTAEATRIQSALLERWRRGGGAFEVALVHAGFGDIDTTVEWLDRAVTDGSLLGAPPNPARTLIMTPLFADVRRHPGFARVRRRLGLE